MMQLLLSSNWLLWKSACWINKCNQQAFQKALQKQKTKQISIRKKNFEESFQISGLSILPSASVLGIPSPPSEFHHVKSYKGGSTMLSSFANLEGLGTYPRSGYTGTFLVLTVTKTGLEILQSLFVQGSILNISFNSNFFAVIISIKQAPYRCGVIDL